MSEFQYQERSLTVLVKRKYAKCYIQKIKSIIWNRFDSVCEVQDNSFDCDEEVEFTLYFLSTKKQMEELISVIDFRFDKSHIGVTWS